jgi:hypothetical protein
MALRIDPDLSNNTVTIDTQGVTLVAQPSGEIMRATLTAR